MDVTYQQHGALIKPPYFQLLSSNAKNCGLHRYLDSDFINRFKQDIQQRNFQLPQFSSWMNDERHSIHGNQPVLRLPLHRAFHVVSCEVACSRFGHPALDPKKISSAGFVIRKLRNGKEYAWMIEDGEALGWQEAPLQSRDPDIHRRLCNNGVLHKLSSLPSYSGEESHPLHIIKTTDPLGKIHTLMFGYLPLGGFYYHRDPANAFDDVSRQQTEAAAAEQLPWPFGYQKPLNQRWQKEHSTPIDRGQPSKSMFELLRVLVYRYHLGESGIDSNTSLEKHCARLWFYDTAHASSIDFDNIAPDDLHALDAHRRMSLLDYLRNCFKHSAHNPLVQWLIIQEKKIDAAGGIHALTTLDKLPDDSGNTTLSYTLFMHDTDAQELRSLLGQRLRLQTISQVKEIPIPKYGQGVEDLYQAVPFVRIINDDGKEQIQWADINARSIVFRVAAPFDPEASRPSLIQIPSLSDLKRGLAKGAAMITPSDTFNLINSLKLNKGVSPDALPDKEPGAGTIQWICSFSLPVITLVAMILLMIMISLLNIVFFWLPWVRICLPFPKMK